MNIYVSRIKSKWGRRLTIIVTFPFMVLLVLTIHTCMWPLHIIAGVWTLIETAHEYWTPEAKP